MLIGIAIGVVALVVGLFWGASLGVEHGRKLERRKLWEKMISDKSFGHEVLETLAKQHGAKLELVEM